MKGGPSPKLDQLRAMREANYDARRRGTTRERPPLALSTDVSRGPCTYRQPKTGLECLRDADHGGHHKFKRPEASQAVVEEEEI